MWSRWIDISVWKVANIHRRSLLLVGVTLGEPPHFWLAESARGLSSSAEPR
jgi:hypothetical protein